MSSTEGQVTQEVVKPVTPINDNQNKGEKDKKSDRFKWWQSLMMLFLTLIVSVGAAYYISDTFLWSKVDENRINEQLKHYKDSVNAEPNNPKHRVNLGYTYFLKGINDEAIKQLKLAIDLDKDNFDAYLNLGIVYNDEERYDDALKMGEKATKLSPRDYKGFLVKGIAFRKLKMYDDSIEALDQANQLMPGNTDIIYEIGLVAENQNAFKEAEDMYKEALNYDPLYKPALEGLDRIAKNDSKK
jgi:tetratricopeptide (TPR) repeat protein